MRTVKSAFVIAILSCLFTSFLAADDIKPKIGLVLSGGGAKGLAHVGVLKLIDSLEIPVDYISGTSMGGIIGALYAIGYSGIEIEKIVGNTSWDNLFTDEPTRKLLPYLQKKEVGRYQISLGLKGFTPVIPSGLISGRKLAGLFSELTYSVTISQNFDRLIIPFRCVAADLVTGKEVILASGSLPRAMRATMSIPTIFSPVEWGDSLLIDGGIINNFPVDVVRKMGAELVIGVNVGAPLKGKSELNDILDVFEQAFFLAGEKKIEENKADTDILISPALGDYTAADFSADAVPEIMKRGEQAARKMIGQLQELKKRYGLQKTSLNTGKRTKQIIHSVFVQGNETISFSFIYNYLGMAPGQSLDLVKLGERITDLYSSGYFESVEYELERVDEKSVALTIAVKEKPSQSLHIGFRYDDFHQLVGAVSVSGTDILIQGLRLENELQFAGLTRFNLEMYLHSRGFNFPLYPLLRFYFKDDPINIYDLEGPKIASYRDRSVTFMAGFGITPTRSVNATCVFAAEYIRSKPDIALFDPNQFPRFKDRLHQVRAQFDLDTVDDILLPGSGVRINGTYENSLKRLKSEVEYTRYQVSAELYLTPALRHSFMLAGVLVRTAGNLPIYKAFYYGGSESFTGLDYDQLVTDHAQMVRFFYRYQYKKDIYLKLLFNTAYDYRISGIRSPSGQLLYGYGIAVQFISIIGPLEITYARSEFGPYRPGEKQNNFYVIAGYKF